MSAKIFTVKRSEIEGRLDPEFYNPKYFEIFRIEKSNWTRLNSIVKTLKHPPEYKRVFAENGYQLIRSQNVRPTGIDLSENPVYLSKEIVENNSGILPKKGDILVVRSGVNAGDIAVVEDELKNTTIGADTLLLNVASEILPKFVQVYFYTDTGRNQLNRYITGATNKHINSFSLKRVYFPIIDLHTQKKCISTFENALSQKEQKQKQAKELLASIDSYLLSELGITLPQKDNSLSKRIFTTKFSEVTGGRLDPLYQFNSSFLISTKYEQVKLAEICNSFISGFGAGKENQTSEINGIIQIRPTNIDSECELKFDKNIYIDKNFEGKKIKKTDVLFNNTNSQDLVGKTAVGESAENMFFSNHITVISINERIIDSYFLKESLNMLQRHKIFYSICTNWNNQSGIGIDLLKTVKIPFPPLPKQKEIAEQIRGIRTQAKQLQAEAEQILQDAKHQVEKMILGE